MTYGVTRLPAWPKPIEGRPARSQPMAGAPKPPAETGEQAPPATAARPKAPRTPRGKAAQQPSAEG